MIKEKLTADDHLWKWNSVKVNYPWFAHEGYMLDLIRICVHPKGHILYENLAPTIFDLLTKQGTVTDLVCRLFVTIIYFTLSTMSTLYTLKYFRSLIHLSLCFMISECSTRTLNELSSRSQHDSD